MMRLSKCAGAIWMVAVVMLGCSSTATGGGGGGEGSALGSGGSGSSSASGCGFSSEDVSCNACLGSTCCASSAACAGNAACVALYECIAGCATEACVNTCVELYPAGADPLITFLDCVDYSCPACGGGSGGSGGSTSGGSGGSTGESCGEPCPSGCCSLSGNICCQPPFCGGDCVGSPCCG